MIDHKYLIIGGGMTAGAALKGIRAVDSEGSIGIIASEAHRPYKRPPLSKALWKGDPLESIWLKSGENRVTVHSSRTARTLDPSRRRVTDDEGETYSYAKLLLATGGAVRTFPSNPDGVIYFRTLDDYRQLRSMTERGEEFIVIGGGFIGSEIAAALSMNGKKVTMIFPEEGIGARVYPKSLSLFLNSYYESKGVKVLAKEGVKSIERKRGTYHVTTGNGGTLSAHGVIAGLGIQPDVTLARDAGLKISNGIEVNESLETSHADIYAAGDVANFFNPALGKRIRVEHEDNALTMGEYAGKAMAGRAVPYHHLPFFYSDLFDLGYEAVGELDSRYETIEQWKEKFKEGVVYYLDGTRVRGVLLWNTWGQVDHARTLIARSGPLDARNVAGMLPVTSG